MRSQNILRLAIFDALRGLGQIRWLFIPLVFFAVGWVQIDYVEFDFASQRARDVNLWDGPLSSATYASVVVFAFTLGFLLVSGDLLVKDLSSGAASMTLVRSHSRSGWWIAKLLALFPLALTYSSIAFLTMLAAGAARLPLALGPSPAARVPWGQGDALYPRFEVLPMPMFFVLVVLYTSFALWAVGAVGLLVSTFLPRTLPALAFSFVWIVGLGWLLMPLYQREVVGTLDPAYRVSYAIHFGGQGEEAASWAVSAAIVLTTIALATLLGSWVLRRTDL